MAGHVPVDDRPKELVQFERFETEWLKKHAGVDVDEGRLEELQHFMNPEIMSEPYEIARKYAAAPGAFEDLAGGFDWAYRSSLSAGNAEPDADFMDVWMRY